ncbi:MAG: VWA domain-containing protein [Candidatus Thermoplasmatota archaeon]
MKDKFSLPMKAFLGVIVIALLTVSAIGSVGQNLPSNTQDTVEQTDGINYKSLSYQVNINESYAVTNVKTVLSNPTDETLEANVTFYVPEEAFLSNLTLVLNGEVYYADVVESEKAKEKYNESVKENRSAVLGEYEKGGLFTQKVNIKSGMEAEVIVRYESFLKRRIGGYYYDMNLELFSQYDEASFEDFSYDIDIKYSEPIKTIDLSEMIDGSYKNYISPSEAEVGYSGELVPGEYTLNYDVMVTGLKGNMSFYEDKKGSYFMHRMRPNVDEMEKIPKDIVFVLDRSGSMSGKKIQQMKASFKHIIGELEKEERFNVITFNENVDSYSEEMLEARSSNKSDVKGYIDSIEASGSTNLNGAILKGIETINKRELGYGERAAMIVLLTDGLPTAGVTNTASIRQNINEANDLGISIFNLGFGSDVDFDLLKSISLENNGYSKRIYEGNDAEEQIVGFYDAISTPLLRDIDLKYENTKDCYSNKVKTLFSGSEIITIGKIENDSEKIESKFKANSKNGTLYVNDTWDVTHNESNSHIPRVWAYKYTNHLMDKMVVEGENESIRSEIVSIATNYSFVTPYTSFIFTVDSSDLDIPSNEGLGDPSDGESSADGGATPGLNMPEILFIVILITILWSRKRKS